MNETEPPSGAGAIDVVSVTAPPAREGLLDVVSAALVPGGKSEIRSAARLDVAATNSRPPPALGLAKWLKVPIVVWKRTAPVAGSRP